MGVFWQFRPQTQNMNFSRSRKKYFSKVGSKESWGILKRQLANVNPIFWVLVVKLTQTLFLNIILCGHFDLKFLSYLRTESDCQKRKWKRCRQTITTKGTCLGTLVGKLYARTIQYSLCCTYFKHLTKLYILFKKK